LEADAEENNFQPVDYETGHPRIEVEGRYDLFGDGAIVLHPTPGHTPGHQSVQVGEVLIAADACYFPETLEDERFPAYGWDRERERESLLWIREQRDSGLTVLYGHEPSAGTFRA
jgi:glyoxylase-like metal-dependent hydrolase (beta-lactamase superfamily II)